MSSIPSGEGSEQHRRDQEGRDNLAFGSYIRGYIEAFEMLRDMLPDHTTMVNARDADGRTPILLAAAFQSWQIIEFLIGLGADEKATGQFGMTIPHQAAIQSTHEVVHMLLHRGHDPSICDIKGFNTLHWALRGQHRDVQPAQTLIEHDGTLTAWDDDDHGPHVTLVRRRALQHDLAETAAWESVFDLLTEHVSDYQTAVLRIICSQFKFENNRALEVLQKMPNEWSGPDGEVLIQECLSQVLSNLSGLEVKGKRSRSCTIIRWLVDGRWTRTRFID